MNINQHFQAEVSTVRRGLACLAGLVFFGGSALQAQQASNAGKPVPPEGPLIQKHAPDFASWTVVEGAAVSVKERLQPGPSSSKKQNAQATTQKTTFVKTGDILHLEMSQDESHTWNIWNKGDLQVVVFPDGKNIGFANKPTGSVDSNPLCIDLSKSDFPGFDWITADNYTGTGSMGGKSCLIFKTTLKASANGLGDEATAYVDVDTRLPIALSNKFGVKLYQFLPAPAEKLVMPTEVQTFIDAEKDKRQKLVRRSAIPY